MTAREDFGEPFLSDGLILIGGLYFHRGLLLLGARAYFSAVPMDIAEATLQTLLAEVRGQRDAD